jgi:molybdopterin/thiamine biosynthesis adenylyltransferase
LTINEFAVSLNGTIFTLIEEFPLLIRPLINGTTIELYGLKIFLILTKEEVKRLLPKSEITQKILRETDPKTQSFI